MKKLIAVSLVAALLLGKTQALAVSYNMDGPVEWGIPTGIRTQSDLERYKKYRIVLNVLGGIGIAGALYADKHSRTLRRRADNTATQGPVQTRPIPGGVETFRDPIPSGIEARGRLNSKAKAYKQSAILGFAAGLSCLVVSYSIRF